MTQVELAELIARLRGRAAFCLDRGELKTPELLVAAADALEARIPQEDELPCVGEIAVAIASALFPGVDYKRIPGAERKRIAAATNAVLALEGRSGG